MCRGGFQFSGDLTYYGGAGTGGSCTSGYVPPGYTTVAMNNVQYSNGRVCGMCVNACYTDNSGERCFNAIVDNRCPVRPPPYAPLTCRCPSAGRTLPTCVPGRTVAAAPLASSTAVDLITLARAEARVAGRGSRMERCKLLVACPTDALALQLLGCVVRNESFEVIHRSGTCVGP